MHSSKSPETSRKQFWDLLTNTERRQYQWGATHHPRGWGARPPASWAPWRASGAHLLLYEVFRPRKNHKQAFGKKLRRHEAEPWRNQSRAPAELFCRGNFPPGGGNHRHHYQRSSHWEGVNPYFISCIQSLSQSLRLVPVGC